MNPFASAGEPGSGDGVANAALSRLLEKLETVLQDTSDDSLGLPLFVVEARLAGRLRTALPGVRFSREDIRGWAVRISS